MNTSHYFRLFFTVSPFITMTIINWTDYWCLLVLLHGLWLELATNLTLTWSVPLWTCAQLHLLFTGTQSHLSQFLKVNKMEFWLVQFVGFVAFSVSSCSYQFKDQKTMFGLRIFSDSLWSLHYFLLAAHAPAFTIMVAVLRAGLSIFMFPQHRLLIITSSAIIVLFICYFFSNGVWTSYLPLLGFTAFGFALYFYENYTISRILMAVGYFIWLNIGILMSSYAEIISSSIGCASIALGFYRHKMLKKTPQPHG